jgi:hypothetical protein
MLTAAMMMMSYSMVNAHEYKQVNLKKKIENTIVYDDLFDLMETEVRALVRLSLEIDEAGNVHVLESDYSNEQVNNLLISKLTNLELDESSNNAGIYCLEFRFKKV